MRRCASLLLIAVIAFALGVSSGPARAQFGGLKDKLKKKASDKVEKKVDDTLDGKDTKSSDDQAKDPQDSGKSAKKGSSGESADGAAAAPAEMALYTKYDFVPGDKVIFYDDLSREEMGEFPSRWKLQNGVFEVAKGGDRPWILCTDRGTIFPKVAEGPLPPKYTFEMDFYSKGPGLRGHWFCIAWFGKGLDPIGYFRLGNNGQTNVRILDKDLASKTLEPELAAGPHAMRIMATSTTLKCYVDNVRVANIPATDGFLPTHFGLYQSPYTEEGNNPMLFGNVRYAEGGKTLKEQLDEAGRIVTHGILFASGSAVIKGESYKTLADIGKLLTESAELRLSIEGHTDSDGADAANLGLSQKRAESVKTYLVENSGVDAGRLETKGWGEGKPIDKNVTPEGKANNRRVELVKL
ncbi:MAG: OmpA family protein [Candidatus Eisenbacteria bacterium]|nr:OmpA family protein [Candidatus Eisenbacteria bacterium]